MITLFCVRPKGVNLGNEVIFLGLSHLLREAFGTLVKIAQVPAEDTGDGALCGLTARSVHEMNQYGMASSSAAAISTRTGSSASTPTRCPRCGRR